MQTIYFNEKYILLLYQIHRGNQTGCFIQQGWRKLFYNRLIQNGSIENASVSGDQITGQAPLNA